MRTMQRHEKPNLPVPHPLPDTIPCASLHPCNERTIVNDAVENLPDGLGGCVQVRLRSVLRDRALARAAAHLAGGARGLSQSV